MRHTKYTAPDIDSDLLDELSAYRHPPFERVGTVQMRHLLGVWEFLKMVAIALGFIAAMALMGAVPELVRKL